MFGDSTDPGVVTHLPLDGGQWAVPAVPAVVDLLEPEGQRQLST